MSRPVFALISLTLLLLGACSHQIEAPADPGVCYSMAEVKGQPPRFNVLARNIPDMEHCAAQLEGMRIRFLQLGGSNNDITGAYQGNFIFLQAEGVFTSATYNGARYPFLVRTGDGRLAVPGAMPAQ